MSLLDDVSIVVTPNGYKAGTLYGVLPTATEGSELVVNGDFATDSDWTKGTGWTISGGVASNDGTSGSNNLTQSGILVVGKQYKIDITVSNYVSGSVEVSAGADPRGSMSANGTYTFYQTCTPTTNFYIIAQTFNGSVDNISVKEWTASDMDVTRATAATRVDENGLVNYAEVLGSELVTNGNFDSNITGWSAKSSTIAWDNGKLKVDNSSGNLYGGAYQNIGLVTGKQYKMTLTMQLLTGSSNGTFMLFTSSASGGSQSLVHTGGALVVGGAAVTETFIFTPASGDVSIQPSVEEANATFTIDNVSVKEVTRNNVPRIDYTGGGCPHILAEPQRTNLIPYSEDFNSGWTKYGSPTINTSSIISPDGTLNGSKITRGSNATPLRYQSLITLNTLYTFSLYAKKGTVDKIYLDIGDILEVEFTLTDEWQRFEITQTPTTFTHIDISFGTSSSGDNFYIYGAQLEAGAYPTSYIPTSGSAVTRNKDVFTRDGISSLINSTEGVLFVEMAALANSGNFRYISLINDANNFVQIYFKDSNNFIAALVKSSGATSFFANHNVGTATNYSKIAIKFKQDDFALWVNGVEVATDTSGNVPSSLSQLALDFSGGNNFEGKIKQLQVFKTALTDAQLTSLTT